MSSKVVSRYSKQETLFNIGLSLALIFFSFNRQSIYFVGAIAIIYLNIIIFVNSIWIQENIEKTIIMRLNLRNKIIKPKIFLWGFLMYCPTFFTFSIVFSVQSLFFINIVILVAYQLTDFILLYLNKKSMVYFLTFTVAFILNTVSYLSYLSSVFGN